MTVDRKTTLIELEQARLTFHKLLDNATVLELRSAFNGTKWTNEELLFHMYLGYLLVLRLRILVLAFGRAPNPISRAFSCALEAATTPFHQINYLTSAVGNRIVCPARLGPAFDTVITRLLRHLDTTATKTWPEACTTRHRGTPTSSPT